MTPGQDNPALDLAITEIQEAYDSLKTATRVGSSYLQKACLIEKLGKATFEQWPIIAETLAKISKEA